MNTIYIYLLSFTIFLIVLFSIFFIANKYSIFFTKYSFRKKTEQSKKRTKNYLAITEISNSKLKRVLATLYALALPKEGWQDSKVKLKFIRAGIREESYFKFFYFIKIVLIFILFIFLSFITILVYDITTFTSNLPLILILSIAGFYAPDIYLYFLTQRRQRNIEESLPNFLDLLLICAESGLSLDASLLKVTTELAPANPELCEEFYLSLLEIRAGADRKDVFSNLALRVTSDFISPILSVFNQVDKFGTSLGDSLRVHSEMIRSERVLKAESIAAKLPLKMLFPLVFCLFPIIIIILIGPAIITISNTVFGS